ncbi:MAG: hypothetical protein AAF456_05850 [Planctomycetota bacterium]
MHRLNLVVIGICFVVTSLSPVGVSFAFRRPQGEINGKITGSFTGVDGRRIKIANAAVFLCDQESGWPINSETGDPINPTLGDLQLDKLHVVETAEDGSFSFDSVKPGSYRIVGQSWSGTRGFPGFDTNYDPSAFVVLHGVAENVVVVAGERAIAYPRQLGDHTLKIVNDPEEAHALLVVSLGPTLGDGILGPMGWGEEFRTNWIGVTQMEVPYVTITGLPSESAIHASLLNYDNNPGVGGASFEAGQREGRLRIIASWSNGHKTPPPELEELTEHIAGNDIQIIDLLPEGDFEPGQVNEQRMKLLEMLNEDGDAMLDVPGFGQQRLADVIAAYAYATIRKR